MRPDQPVTRPCFRIVHVAIRAGRDQKPMDTPPGRRLFLFIHEDIDDGLNHAVNLYLVRVVVDLDQGEQVDLPDEPC